jgi:hypothetical protein
MAKLRLIRLAVMAGFSLAWVAPASAQQCEDVLGKFEAMLDNGPDCGSPVHICTNGTLTGDLAATYHFEVDSMNSDPNHAGRSTFVGHTVITASDGSGQAFSQDAGTLTSTSATTAILANHIDITSGSGSLSGANGKLLARGTVNFASGAISGFYVGWLCVDNNTSAR